MIKCKGSHYQKRLRKNLSFPKARIQLESVSCSPSQVDFMMEDFMNSSLLGLLSSSRIVLKMWLSFMLFFTLSLFLMLLAICLPSSMASVVSTYTFCLIFLVFYVVSR
jgi:hypothetical protein